MAKMDRSPAVRCQYKIRAFSYTNVIAGRDAVTFTVPLTVAPFAGEVMEVVGGVVSPPPPPVGVADAHVDCAGPKQELLAATATTL